MNPSRQTTTDLYILTDAENYVTACRATIAELQAEVARCKLTAPIRVVRWNKHRAAPDGISYPRWKEVETFQWP